MAIAALVVRIQADIANFEKNIKGVESTLQRTGRNLESIGSRLTQGITLPLAAAVGLVAKSAIAFESSFAGIRKTVDATDEEFAQMAVQMRNLAKEIPVSVNELNRLGETAGALNIPKENIVDFAKVMAQLGATTNVTSDQAAESIGQIQTIFKSAGKDTDRFASTLVDLGNKGASTEAQILELANRTASAGAAIGLSQAEVLGFSSAIANVGINAEAGGTAISKVFSDLSIAVSEGGSDLKAFAEVAGQSSKEFATLFRQDAAQAVQVFIEGIGKAAQAGGDLNLILKDLGFTEVRQARALRDLALSGDNLANSLNIARGAWRENTALAKEFGERAKTTASQLQIMWQNLEDVRITLGAAFLPAVNAALKGAKPFVETLSEMAKAFAGLPEPIRNTTLALIGLVAALGPVVFVTGKVTQSWAALLATMRLGLDGFSKAIGAVSRFAVPLALLTSGLYLASEAQDAFGRSTEEGTAFVLSAIPAFGLLMTATDQIRSSFPKLGDAFDDVVSIVRSSVIIAFNEVQDAFELTRAKLGELVDSLRSDYQPVFDALEKALDRVGKVINGVVIPALAGAGFAVAQAFPPLRDFLFLVSKIPGFGDIAEALDKTAARMRVLSGEARAGQASVGALGVVFKNSTGSVNAWDSALGSMRGSVTSASTAFVAFGNNVTTKVTTPVRKSVKEVEKLAKEAAKVAQGIKAAIADSLNELRIGDLSADLPGITVDLSKLVSIIPPDLPDIKKIIQGFDGAGDKLPGLEVKIDAKINPLDPDERRKLDEEIERARREYLAVVDDLGRSIQDVGKLLPGLTGDMVGLVGVGVSGFARMAAAALNFGKSVAASTASVIDMGLTIFSIMQQVIAFLERDNLTARAVQDFENAAGGARQLAADAALAGVSLDHLYDTDSASAFRREAERITTAIRNQREALERYNLSWRDFNSTVAQSQVDQIVRTLITDFNTLTRQGANPTRVIEGMSDALNQLIVDAVRTGTRIPIALRPMIESMIRAGRVTEEAAAAILGLEASSLPALKDIEEAAARYGLTLDDLGDKVKQLSINEQARQIIADWQLLVVESGASAETIARAMQEAVQGMVTAALTAGLTIPEGMRPILQTMVDLGLLVDANGDKLENLDDIQFGRDLTQAIDDLIAKLDELIDAFSLVGTTAEDAWRRARNGAEITGKAIPRGSFEEFADEAENAGRRIEDTFGNLQFPPIIIPIEWDTPDIPGATVPALAAGGVVTRPTLALIGEAGPEAVVPLSQLGSFSSPEPDADTSTVIFEVDGHAIAEATVPHIPGVVRRYGLV